MISQMDVTPMISQALATLRTLAPGYLRLTAKETETFREAFNVLDNAGVFAEIDERNEYASAEEILAEAAVQSVTGTLDPAEWGDTTRADMARHQHDPSMCKAGPDDGPALHSGLCPVWAVHHNLTGGTPGAGKPSVMSEHLASLDALRAALGRPAERRSHGSLAADND